MNLSKPVEKAGKGAKHLERVKSRSRFNVHPLLGIVVAVLAYGGLYLLLCG